MILKRKNNDIYKKIEKLEKLIKIGDKEAKAGMEVLKKVKEQLENFGNVREIELDSRERKIDYLAEKW